MADVVISIGSNLGNRRNNINAAIEKLKRRIRLIKVSRIYKTKPQEGVEGGWFLNGVILGETSLSPVKLLKFLQSIECQLGRPLDHKKNTARTIDLDIIFYSGKTIKRKNLIVPHPKLSVREFVLKGLMEINPDMMHPETKKTVKQMWRDLKNGNSKNERRNKKNSQKRPY